MYPINGLYPWFVLYVLTSPVRHGVEEAPGGVMAGAGLDEGDIVRRLDADHGEQLHQQSRRRRVQGGVPAGRYTG